MIKEYKVLGLMSGSSLDGLDLALVSFLVNTNAKKNSDFIISWEIAASDTIPIHKEIHEKLSICHEMNAINLIAFSHELGTYFGNASSDFLSKKQLDTDFIASHGHTVHHYPNQGFSLQIGHGASIAAAAQKPVIWDFRQLDVALGGQGAPVAPIVDELLFNDFTACLNIGGIANISFNPKNKKRIAFDIGGANQVFNHLANQLGMPYDDAGKIAASGQLLPNLLHQVNQLSYFDKKAPKSLGNDWVKNKLIPIYDNYEADIKDKLHTAVVQLAQQTASDLSTCANGTSGDILASGGGALNDFLIKSIQTSIDEKNLNFKVVKAEDQILHYKEALLMALMGILRLYQLPNVMKEFTGASQDSCNGNITWH